MRQLRRLTEMSWADRFALVRMAVLLLLMKAALVFLPFRTVHQAVRSLARRRPSSVPDDLAFIKRNAWAAEVGGRRLLGDKPCLAQALAVQAVLGRKGIETDLRIGVAKGNDGKLRAHAWVDYKGRTIVGGWRSPHAFRLLRPVSGVLREEAL